ncbi:hypothetical protein AAG570_010173 [Ranatra chinensis]|uniref:Eukaryotic translation initiation factor 2A n=1 Tax=Ranatra chinensis TaxID=642074 RepID=A0ABD0YM66_9HEMI
MLSCVSVRGSTGVSVNLGPPSYEVVSSFPKDDSKACKCMQFSPDGGYFAWANGKTVNIVDTKDWTLVAEIKSPRVRCLQFSPKGTYLMTWETFLAPKEGAEGVPNLNFYKSANGELVHSLEHKKQIGWEPQWTTDELLFSRNSKNDIIFYSPENMKTVVNRVANQRVHEYSISPGPPPYHILCYIPGAHGQPSLGKLFQYPKFDSTVACKSFFQADRVDMMWNMKGNGVLLLTTLEVDKTGTSYYGKHTLHFISIKGETAIVQLSKEGPIHNVAWSPQSTEFCVVYGTMPAKATLFNTKCEPLFDFGTAPRNSIYYNPHGNILLLGGFGNLAGGVEIWDVTAKKLICKMSASDTTLLSWSPDGQHFMTATTAPRLRMCNGFKMWHYTGTLLYERPWNKQEELWEVLWQNFPEKVFKVPQISYKPVEGIASSQPQASKQVYRPPRARGTESNFKRQDLEEPKSLETANNPSKAAMKQKKKREAKKAAKAAAATVENQDDDVEDSSLKQSNGLRAYLEEFTTMDPAKMKKLGRLRSKLLEIERLKEQQKSGRHLEINQLEKIKKEDQLLKEMKELTL